MLRFWYESMITFECPVGIERKRWIPNLLKGDEGCMKLNVEGKYSEIWITRVLSEHDRYKVVTKTANYCSQSDVKSMTSTSTSRRLFPVRVVIGAGLLCDDGARRLRTWVRADDFLWTLCLDCIDKGHIGPVHWQTRDQKFCLLRHNLRPWAEQSSNNIRPLRGSPTGCWARL